MTEAKKDILEALRVSELPEEAQQELLLDIGDLILRGSLVRLVEHMDDETVEAFNALLETNPEEEVLSTFLNERVPNADALVQETIEELRSDILAVTGN